MAINLGAAYVDIVPSTRGMASQLQKQIVAPTSAAGDAAGAGFGSRFAAGVSNFVGGVADSIDKTLTGVGIAAAGAIAVTLFSGFDRLTAIQDSTAALTVLLGDAGQAATLLDEVLNVVRGTPFNLDQFSTATTKLVGMGIEAEKIPGVLTAIGNASALQGKDAGLYVDRLTRVFGQIQAAGRVTGQDLLQLSETGVNGLAILANTAGTTMEEMRGLVRKGLIPADEAIDALVSGIMNGTEGAEESTKALGGVMQALRLQISGLIGGTKAAVSRAGQSFLLPFVPAITAALQGLIVLIDKAAPKLQEFAQKIADSAGFQKLVEWLQGIPDMTFKVSGAFEGLTAAVGPFFGLLASFATKGLASIPFIGSFIPVIGPIVGLLGGIIAQSPELRESLGRLLEQLGELGGKLAAVFIPLIEKVLPVIETILGLGLEGATGVVSYINDIVDTFAESGIGGVWDKVVEDWNSVSTDLKTSLDTAWGTVSTWVEEKVEQAPGLFGRIADGFAEGFDTALNGGGEGGSKPILDQLGVAFEEINEATATQQEAMKENVSTTWPEAFVGWIDAVINGDENGPGIVDRMQGITDSIDTWVDNEGFQSLAATGAQLAGALWLGFMSTVPQAARTVVQGVAVSLLRAFFSFWWMFSQMGVSIAMTIVEGLLTFIRDKFPNVLQDAIIAGLKNVPVLGPLIQAGSFLGIDGERASGGPVNAGGIYLVGEKGPELMVTGSAGTIIPNNALASYAPPDVMTAGGGANQAPTFHITAPSTDAKDIVRLSERSYRKQAIFAGGIGG